MYFTVVSKILYSFLDSVSSCNCNRYINQFKADDAFVDSVRRVFMGYGISSVGNTKFVNLIREIKL